MKTRSAVVLEAVEFESLEALLSLKCLNHPRVQSQAKSSRYHCDRWV